MGARYPRPSAGVSGERCRANGVRGSCRLARRCEGIRGRRGDQFMTLDLTVVVDILRAIDASVPYRSALVFYGAYPIAMACVWIVLSIAFARRREQKRDDAEGSVAGLPPGPPLFVSVVIPAHTEGETIARTLDALLAVDYPAYEVIVVNDGSTDDTADVVRRYLHTGVVRLLDKTMNEGKAMGLNDAIPLCQGEIVV